MQPRVGQAGFLLASSFDKKQTTTTKPEQIVNLLITNPKRAQKYGLHDWKGSGNFPSWEFLRGGVRVKREAFSKHLHPWVTAGVLGPSHGSLTQFHLPSSDGV